MKKRPIFFGIIIMLTFQTVVSGQNKPLFKTTTDLTNPNNNYYKNSWTTSKYPIIVNSNRSLGGDTTLQKRTVFSLLQPVAPSFYTKHLGFFCKSEVKMDKLTPIALRFRLGSMEYVNYLEQKPNTIKAR